VCVKRTPPSVRKALGKQERALPSFRCSSLIKDASYESPGAQHNVSYSSDARREPSKRGIQFISIQGRRCTLRSSHSRTFSRAFEAKQRTDSFNSRRRSETLSAHGASVPTSNRLRLQHTPLEGISSTLLSHPSPTIQSNAPNRPSSLHLPLSNDPVQHAPLISTFSIFVSVL